MNSCLVWSSLAFLTTRSLPNLYNFFSDSNMQLPKLELYLYAFFLSLHLLPFSLSLPSSHSLSHLPFSLPSALSLSLSLCLSLPLPPLVPLLPSLSSTLPLYLSQFLSLSISLSPILSLSISLPPRQQQQMEQTVEAEHSPNQEHGYTPSAEMGSQGKHCTTLYKLLILKILM